MTPPRRDMTPWTTLLLAIVALIVGVSVALEWTDIPIAGDPTVYRERMIEIEDGGVPYLDPVYEHLPGMLFPMWGARVLSGFGGAFEYTLAFGAIMVASLAGTAALLGILGAKLDRPVARRWLAVSVPLFPLVVFRNDPWVVMLTVTAIAVAGTVGLASGVMAVLSKGWPVAIAPYLFAQGRRKTAGWMVVAGVIGAVIMVSPGFIETQDATGLHSETLVGSLLALGRLVGGQEIGIEWTTAVYLDAETWLVALQAAIGALIALAGTGFVLKADDERRRLLATGMVVAGVILASRLFSMQYLLWLTPFVALSDRRGTRWSMVLINIASLALLLSFPVLFDETPWWWVLLAIRNLTLLSLLAFLAVESATDRTRDRSAVHSGGA